MQLKQCVLAFTVISVVLTSAVRGQEKKVKIERDKTLVNDVDVEIQFTPDRRVEPKNRGTTPRGIVLLRRADDAAQTKQILETLKKYGLKGQALEEAMVQIKKIIGKQPAQPLQIRLAPDRRAVTDQKIRVTEKPLIVDQQIDVRVEKDSQTGEKVDGDVKVDAKAVIVGPDGSRREIDLSDVVKKRITAKGGPIQGVTIPLKEPPLIWKQLENLEGAFKASGIAGKELEQIRKAIEQATKLQVGEGGERTAHVFVTLASPGGRFMVGIDCTPASEVLREQLRLGRSGLVVNSVFEDSPAKKAGIRKNDVLTKANDKDLASLEDLVKNVQEAGKNKKDLALTYLRKGALKTVKIRPQERKAVKVSDNDAVFRFERRIGGPPLANWTRSLITPNDAEEIRLIQRADANPEVAEMKKQIQHLQDQVKELQALVKKQALDKKDAAAEKAEAAQKAGLIKLKSVKEPTSEKSGKSNTARVNDVIGKKDPKRRPR